VTVAAQRHQHGPKINREGATGRWFGTQSRRERDDTDDDAFAPFGAIVPLAPRSSGFCTYVPMAGSVACVLAVIPTLRR
jgi:hypothetical protein